MKNEQSEGESPPHQTVAGGFGFKSGGKTIAVEFTEQKLSAHAGTATFWAWLRPRGWRALLARQLPHAPSRSPNHLTAVDKALAFMHGLFGEARKLAHGASVFPARPAGARNAGHPPGGEHRDVFAFLHAV